VSKSFAMSLGGLAAIVLDGVVVASVVGLLLLTRWIRFGFVLDVLAILIVGDGLLAWFCGRRFSQFLTRQDK
jgi:hypothetical protein